jgi:hypothetical protein
MIALPDVGRRAALEFGLITKKGWQNPVTGKLKPTQHELASFRRGKVLGVVALTMKSAPPLRMTTGVWSRYDPAPLRMTKQSWPSTDFCGISSHRRW